MLKIMYLAGMAWWLRAWWSASGYAETRPYSPSYVNAQRNARKNLTAVTLLANFSVGVKNKAVILLNK